MIQSTSCWSVQEAMDSEVANDWVVKDKYIKHDNGKTALLTLSIWNTRQHSLASHGKEAGIGRGSR